MKADNTISLDAYKRLIAEQGESDKKTRRARKSPRHEESTLQRACVAWFRAQYPEHALMLFAVPNGGGRSRVEAAIMNGEGVTAGVADLILLEARGGYGALCIEMKTTEKSSRQRASQKAWQDAAVKAGNHYALIRTLEGFQVITRWYLNLPKEGIVKISGKELLSLHTEAHSLWKDALIEKPEPGAVCCVKLMYDTYEATWDGHDWIDETGFRLAGVIGWRKKLQK